jgi:LytS/YehU family sensor histidine kinase
LILSVLCIGFNDAVKIAIGWFRDRKNFELLQKENIQTQLSLLQQQINPHFFMNTLNNIHALIDYDSEMAKKSVIKLSKLMRVLLYEIEDYTLRKEIDFISDYLELMRIRVNENVEIRYEYPGNIPAVNLPPLLFISFVENSFKHGILANGKSFIHIKFEIKEGFLCVWIANSRHDKHSESPIKEKIGINNSKKRLDLIYGKHYTHIVTESDTSYEVKIKVPLYETPMPGH